MRAIVYHSYGPPEVAKLMEVDNVLVYGATGAIGSAAVQLLKYFGANVTAVCDTKNVALVKSLGAAIVIDYQTTDFTKTEEKFDFIFDAVGKSSKVLFPIPTINQEDVKFLRDLAEKGLYKPVIDRHYNLDQILEAYRYVESGQKVGNVILKIVE